MKGRGRRFFYRSSLTHAAQDQRRSKSWRLYLRITFNQRLPVAFSEIPWSGIGR